MDPRLIGYVSAAVLVVTMVHQIRRQWASGNDSGVSPWLFAGQLTASLGFTAYSVLGGDAVFIVTNACMAIAACCGLAIVGYHRVRRRHHESSSRASSDDASSGQVAATVARTSKPGSDP